MKLSKNSTTPLLVSVVILLTLITANANAFGLSTAKITSASPPVLQVGSGGAPGRVTVYGSLLYKASSARVVDSSGRVIPYVLSSLLKASPTSRQIIITAQQGSRPGYYYLRLYDKSTPIAGKPVPIKVIAIANAIRPKISIQSPRPIARLPGTTPAATIPGTRTPVTRIPSSTRPVNTNMPSVRGVNPSKIRLLSNGSPVKTLVIGSNLHLLTAARIVDRYGKVIPGTMVALSKSSSPSNRQIAMLAKTNTRPGGGYLLALYSGRMRINGRALITIANTNNTTVQGAYNTTETLHDDIANNTSQQETSSEYQPTDNTTNADLDELTTQETQIPGYNELPNNGAYDANEQYNYSNPEQPLQQPKEANPYTKILLDVFTESVRERRQKGVSAKQNNINQKNFSSNLQPSQSQPEYAIVAQPEVSLSDCKTHPENPKHADGIYLSFAVKNNGQGLAVFGPGSSLFMASISGNSVADPTIVTGQLAIKAGANKRRFSKRWAPGALAAGNYTATVVIDPDQVLNDSDPTNNSLECSFSVSE